MGSFTSTLILKFAKVSVWIKDGDDILIPRIIGDWSVENIIDDTSVDGDCVVGGLVDVSIADDGGVVDDGVVLDETLVVGWVVDVNAELV